MFLSVGKASKMRLRIHSLLAVATVNNTNNHLFHSAKSFAFVIRRVSSSRLAIFEGFSLVRVADSLKGPTAALDASFPESGLNNVFSGSWALHLPPAPITIRAGLKGVRFHPQPT